MSKRNGTLITIAAVWDSAWKIAAIYKAARRGDWKWLGPLTVVNSVGLLPMAYIFFIAKDNDEDEYDIPELE
jgi:hypothetical protein